MNFRDEANQDDIEATGGHSLKRKHGDFLQEIRKNTNAVFFSKNRSKLNRNLSESNRLSPS